MRAVRDKADNIMIFLNNTINDINLLAINLKPLSKNLAENIANLKNKLLLASEVDIRGIIKDLLSALLKASEIKGQQMQVIQILTKVISFFKLQEENLSVASSAEFGGIVQSIIDVLFLMINKHKDATLSLRIIQATYSLIEQHFLSYLQYVSIVRIYAICLQSCSESLMIQKISASALFALTEIVFSSSHSRISKVILQQMLEYLIHKKKFLWLNSNQVQGIIWDLLTVAIKNIKKEIINKIGQEENLLKLLAQSYKICIEVVFNESKENLMDSSSSSVRSKEQIDKSLLNLIKGSITDFVRFYKTFIYIIIRFYFTTPRNFERYFPFREDLHRFKLLYQLPKNKKLYIFLEGVHLLINQNSSTLFQQIEGVILLDVFNKVSEQLSNDQVPLQILPDRSDLYIFKMNPDYNKITFLDLVRLTKITIIDARKKIESESLKLAQKIQQQENEQVSTQVNGDQSSVPLKKRWERLIKIVIKIIKNLTSLNLKEGSNDQIVRKLIGQLQSWFIVQHNQFISSRNLILHQLLSISTHMNSVIQSIKASQCMQIASNIVYVCYDTLDTYGLTLIMRLIAGVYVNWQLGKGFDELQEVCLMSEKIYQQNYLARSGIDFSKTMKAFVQCINGLLADLQIPSTEIKNSKNSSSKHSQKYLKMIDYLLDKLRSCIIDKSQYIRGEWMFLTGFWSAFAASKNKDVQSKAMSHFFQISTHFIKHHSIQQSLIIQQYYQLSKMQIKFISHQIILQLKQFIPFLNEQAAILTTIKIATQLSKGKKNTLHEEIYQLFQMIIKQTIFKVKSNQIIQSMILQISFLSQSKGDQYKIVSLLWNVSDHLKQLSQIYSKQDRDKIWSKFFRKMVDLAKSTKNHETKQSCIHTFTQIVASLISVIGKQLFVKLLRDQFLSIFSQLMCFSNDKKENNQQIKQQPLDQKQKSINKESQIKQINRQMMGYAIKNVIKIVHKCINVDSDAAYSLIEDILALIILQVGQQKVNQLDYLVELNNFLEFMSEFVVGEEDSKRKMKNKILQLWEQIYKSHQKIDKTSYSWKKYNSSLDQISQMLQIKQKQS